MFIRALFVLSAPSLFAVAGPTPSNRHQEGGQCNTGELQCCNTVQQANSEGVASLYGLLGIVLQPITGLVGLGCTPITAIGLGQGAACAQQPVCCQGTQMNGLVNVGCVPISL